MAAYLLNFDGPNIMYPREGTGIGIKKYGEKKSAKDVSKKANDKKVFVKEDGIKEEFRGTKGAYAAAAMIESAAIAEEDTTPARNSTYMKNKKKRNNNRED